MRADLLAEERRASRRFRLGGALALGAVAAGLSTGSPWLAARAAALLPVASSAVVAAAEASRERAAHAVPAGAGNAIRGEGEGARGDGPRSAAGTAPPASAGTAPTSAAVLKTRPLSAWLGEVARDARRDLVISPELRGDLTASEPSPLPWQQRLEAYARVFGFAFRVGDGLIEVTREEVPPRGVPGGGGEEVPAGPGNDVGSRSPGAPGPGEDRAASVPVDDEPPPQTRVVRLAYSAAKETAAVLDKAGKALDVAVAADVTSNAVVLSGQPAAISRVSAVLKELDLPRRRILLDAKIVEVTRSARLDLGVEWKITGTKVGGDVKFPPPASEAGSAALLIATGGATALDARISALEASGKLHIVSRPSVVMLEGSPATIESARILRIRLPSRGAVVADDVVESPSAGRATEEIPVGVRLEVTPAVRGGGRVLLRIKAKSSSLGAPLPPDDIPEELSRMVDAEVLVHSGETAVLGGLTRESGTNSGAGVPGLRRVPIAGLLFGKKSDEKEEEELMVIVTPRVLD